MRLKTLFIQTNIFFTLFISFAIALFEIPPRIVTRNNKTLKPKICYEILLNKVSFIYSMCPNTYYKIDPGPDYPQMQYVESWIDNYGGRKPKSKWKINEEFKKQKIFLIGDSFIEAEEMPYEETIYGIINNKFQKDISYGLGVGSWNPIQFRKSIEMINKKNVIYDIYIFANDFNHDSPRSVYMENKFKENNLDKNKESLITWLSRRLNSSYTYKKIKKIYREKIINPESRRKVFWDYYFEEIKSTEPSCEILNHSSFKEFNPQMKNYISLSLPSKCWNSNQTKAYEEAIKELDKSIEIASKLNSKIRIILIPPGWSFPYENTAGRESYHYTIPTEKSFSFYGLRNKLISQYGSIFYDIEKDLSEEINSYKKSECSNQKCKNKFYFSNDGHLNQRSHRFLYKLLYSDMKKNKNLSFNY